MADTTREALLPCPFCGCRMPSDDGHDAGCYFTVRPALNAAPPGDLSLAPAILSAWNRRAALSQQAVQADAMRAVVTKYTIDGDPRYLGDRDIHIERAKQIEGPALWAVRRMGECLNKQGEWEWEPMPSSRDDAFLERCRFATEREAIDAAMGAAQEKQ